MVFTIISKNKVTGRKIALSCIAGSFEEVLEKISSILPGLEPISIIYELEKNKGGNQNAVSGKN